MADGGANVPCGNVKMLTTCPAFQQGLARLKLDETWARDFIARVKQGGIEHVLL